MAKWTIEALHAEASQYTHVKFFRKHSKSAYNKASSLGILKEVCSHMLKLRRNKYTLLEISKEALTHSRRSDFEHNSQQMYDSACRQGLIDSICSHMGKKYQSIWNKDTIAREALQYTTRKAFAVGSKTAYQVALKLDIVNGVCEHMVTGDIPSDNDCLYIWRIKDTNIYKIGITSQKLGYERINRVSGYHKVDAEIVAYTKVLDAFAIERVLHKKYDTPQDLIISGDGYSEFRTLTDDELSNVLDFLKKNMAEGILNYPYRLNT